MTKTFLITAGIMGFIGVVMSFIGVHYLFGNLTPQHMADFSMAVQIQMYHTLAILAVTFFNRYVSRSAVNTVFYFFLFGILLFSFPEYINSTTEVTGLSMGPFSFLTTVGTVLLLAGWISVIWSGLVYVHHKRSHKSE